MKKVSLEAIEKSFSDALKRASDLQVLDSLRVEVLGKKGSLTQALRSVGSLPAKERPKFGGRVNVLREKLEKLLQEKRVGLEQAQESQNVQSEKVDVTLPGRKSEGGGLHPLSLVERKILGAFSALGFSSEEGPEIETDYYNFGALNFPKDHPARDMQDTFFMEGDLLLRTHTSPVQIRTMEKQGPPLRMVVPGRVYRHDSDVSHSPVFHQVEGLCVGPEVTFGHLKGTLEAFVHMTFGSEVGTRFRPSFFPFTEPSAEVDMECSSCRGKGCRVCKGTGWLEILGAGMVDPNVFEAVGKKWTERGEGNPYDPEKISGFAFGMGIERIAMVLYGIDDIRLFFENDIRFLQQFTE